MALTYDEQNNIYVDDEDGAVFDGDTEELIGYLEEDEPEEEAEPYEFNPEDWVDPLEQQISELKSEVEAAKRDLDRGRQRGQWEQQQAFEQAIADAEDAELEAEDAWADDMETLSSKLGGRPISETQAQEIHDRLPDDYTDTDIERAAWQAGIDTFNDRDDIPLSERQYSGPASTGSAQRADYMSSRLAEMQDEEMASGGAVEEAESGGGASSWMAGFAAGSGDTDAGASDSGLGRGRKPGDSIN